MFSRLGVARLAVFDVCGTHLKPASALELLRARIKPASGFDVSFGPASHMRLSFCMFSGAAATPSPARVAACPSRAAAAQPKMEPDRPGQARRAAETDDAESRPQWLISG